MTHFPRDGSAGRADNDRISVVMESADPPPQVVLVGRSQVTLVVLSKIAERVGLRATAHPIASAGQVILKGGTLVAILDGGADLRDCDEVLDAIRSQKRVGNAGLPFVIMLSTGTRPADLPHHAGVIDTVVAKPITPERLQPLLISIRDARTATA